MQTSILYNHTVSSTDHDYFFAPSIQRSKQRLRLIKFNLAIIHDKNLIIGENIDNIGGNCLWRPNSLVKPV